MFRAKRILLRDELPDFENAPRFASRELKALGLSSFGRAAIWQSLLQLAQILEECLAVNRPSAPTVDVVEASVKRVAEIPDFGLASRRRILPEFLHGGDRFVTPVRLGANLFQV
jgi:hypothetical protein